MGGFRKLNLYFSILALVVSAVVCIAKGITLPGAIMRVFAASAAFYILGTLMTAVLTRDAEEKPREQDAPALMQETDGEFEEMKFPVVDLEEKDIPTRG